MTAPLDRSAIGSVLPPLPVTVEEGQVRLFLKAIGDNRAAGDLGGMEIPPTFAFCLQSLAERDSPRVLAYLGMQEGTVLHAEQEFTYREPVRIGDALTIHTRIADIYAKQNGALEFIALETRLAREETDCLVSRTLLVRKLA